jgi:hypothetical protein
MSISLTIGTATDVMSFPTPEGIFLTYTGLNVPANTCQARAVLATRLRTM